jgi:D-sorbitol dehydrogenase (acceptor)
MKFLSPTTLLAALLSTTLLNAQAADSGQQALIARGKYLATAGDCQACHRTREDANKLPLSGGYVIDSPMGAIISSNITPSKQYGIGNYTEAQFAAAVRDGIRADGANLYPAMPYTAYRGLSDADIHAIYAYVMEGVPPVEEAVPPTNLTFPFSQRWLMKGWNLLFLHGQPAVSQPVAEDKVARGKYLVDTLGHCGSCHTPRNVLMAESGSRYLGGGSVGGWYAPNITSDTVSGIGTWSEDELMQYLRSGHVEGKGQAAGGMAGAIEHSFRHLQDNDLHAIVAYLKTIPALREAGQIQQRSAVAGNTQALPTSLEPLIDRSPTAMTNSSSVDGAQLYEGACASCHQPNGKGTADQFYPSLTNNSAVGDVRADNLVMAIADGVHRDTNDYKVSMPAFGEQMNNEQIAAVSNFVLQHFGYQGISVTAQKVQELRQGGPAPLLIQAMPYLMAAGAILALLVLLLIVRLFRRRKT